MKLKDQSALKDPDERERQLDELAQDIPPRSLWNE
jgi:hypothetical protein